LLVDHDRIVVIIKDERRERREERLERREERGERREK
jgi:hypothetical protein